MDYQEKIESLKYYSLVDVYKHEFLFFNLDTKIMDNQVKSKIILFTKEYPFIIE